MASEEESGGNLFANDGSFMDMFKRLQEQQNPPPKGSERARGQKDSNDSFRSGGARPANSEQQKTRDEAGPRTARPTVDGSEERRHEEEDGNEERRAAIGMPPQQKASQVAVQSMYLSVLVRVCISIDTTVSREPTIDAIHVPYHSH